MPAPVRRKLNPVQLTAIIFLTVSGGPYGLEPLLHYAGQNGALLLLMITPILWDIPTIAVVLELNSLMPLTGGYYQWVKRALGLRWAFYEGWWTWIYTFVDLAIYPVLFVSYASFFFPEIIHYKIPVCLIIIWASAGLNVLGVVPVGRVSLFLGAIVITPFICLFIYQLTHSGGHFSFPALSFKNNSFSTLGVGLYTIMWNFIGWDNVTTYAEEVNKPVKTYLYSVIAAFILVFFFYFIALLAAQQTGIDPELLNEKGWPVLGNVLGVYWLGALLSIGGMASTLGLYSAILLSVSRIPEVMSEDGLLHKKLQVLHPRFKTPYVSIMICSLVVSGMILWAFEELLIIDITVYGAALFLEYIALIVLRKTLPSASRPFKIPMSIWGLCIMALLPLSVYVIALSAAFIQSDKTLASALFALASLLSAELMWHIIAWRKAKVKQVV